MSKTRVDAGNVNDVLRFDCSAGTARDLAALEELLAKEVEFAQAVGDILFVLEAQRSCCFPKRGCFSRRIGDHRPF